MRWARAQGVPTIVSLHTCFETYFAYYGLGWVRRWVERYLARFYERNDYVLVPTVAILKEFSTAMPSRRVRLWSRGVDHGLFSPANRDDAWRAAQGYESSDDVILFFGRLVREKGHHLR